MHGMEHEKQTGTGNPEEVVKVWQALQALYRQRQQEMQVRYARDLPLEELLFDRWERARQLGFGPGASIYHNSYVYGRVKVGAHTWIGPFVLLDGSGGLEIGAYCSISAGVHIYTHDSVAWALSGGRQPCERAPVSIGDCCYIGSQVVIAKGVTIGDHCVIGAGAFVNRDIPPYSIAAGIPCRLIGRVRLNDAGVVTLEYEREKQPLAG
jgi:acetyltransferase-like isoleucine patch superfamily enzyme